jgi:hypothetical protein
VRASGIGGGTNATTEGGVDTTALTDPQQLVADRSRMLWRRRVSGVEEARQPGGPVSLWDPWGNISFRMEANRWYTFNVGIRVFSDRTVGAGVFAAVQSLSTLDVWRLTTERIG